jgi:hypothetical protein
MSEGIRNSKIVLVCANSTYQGRPNCMFELRETARLYPEKIVTLLVEGHDMKASKISCLSQNKIWTSSGNTVSKEMDNILKPTEMMYCHIGFVAQDKRWKSPDQIPPELVVDLLKAVQPLVSILNNADCLPSMPRKVFVKKAEKAEADSPSITEPEKSISSEDKLNGENDDKEKFPCVGLFKKIDVGQIQRGGGQLMSENSIASTATATIAKPSEGESVPAYVHISSSKNSSLKTNRQSKNIKLHTEYDAWNEAYDS